VRLSQLYGPGRFGISFEVFPPKTPDGESQLMSAIRDLLSFEPAFISCTFGAGGSTRDRTLELICRIRDTFGVRTVAHRTCVGASVGEIREWLGRLRAMGVENVVALRGDPPKDRPDYQPPQDGLAHASDLVALIRREFPELGVAVAGYPETHLEAPSAEVDLANLKRKVKAGADIVLTQLFYDNNDFFDFRRRYQQVGIRVPLVPGVLPVVSLSQIQRIVSLCGAKIPGGFLAALERERDDPAGQLRAGVAHAIRQCQDLIDAGVPGLHFYVLNRSEGPLQILRALRLPARDGGLVGPASARVDARGASPPTPQPDRSI
jgi:methylenetetrahydrofolate reductase (NADPH)